ncbi:cytochrome P450 2B11-like [Amblyomma americanum]
MVKQFHRLENWIAEAEGQPMSLQRPLQDCAAHIAAALLYGSGLPEDTLALRQMTDLIEKLRIALFEGPPFSFVPLCVRHIFERFPFTRYGRLRKAIHDFDMFTIRHMDDPAWIQKEETDKNFIRSYMRMTEKANNEKHSMFQHRFLVGTAQNLIVGGTFTTATRAQLHFLNFAVHQDTIQTRVQREIDAAVGQHRTPTWEDRKKMPFTLACVWEMERWKTSGALVVPRQASKDLIVDNFFIPKGTAIFFNLWAVLNNPAHWKEPHRFNPSRYFNNDESMVPKKPLHFIPFSIGRRACPAGKFAITQIFLLITIVLQKYHVVLDQPLQHDFDDPELPLRKLKDVRFRFLPRNYM